MKELKLYECEVCHTRYAERQKAKDCEKSHVDKPKMEFNKKYTLEELGVTYDDE